MYEIVCAIFFNFLRYRNGKIKGGTAKIKIMYSKFLLNVVVLDQYSEKDDKYVCTCENVEMRFLRTEGMTRIT